MLVVQALFVEKRPHQRHTLAHTRCTFFNLGSEVLCTLYTNEAIVEEVHTRQHVIWKASTLWQVLQGTER